ALRWPKTGRAWRVGPRRKRDSKIHEQIHIAPSARASLPPAGFSLSGNGGIQNSGLFESHEMRGFMSSSTIHGSFERFQTIDLPFRLAIAPRFSDRISHRVDVSPRRASETLHRVQASFLGVSQPGSELANALASEHAPESHGESTHCRELRPVLFHCIDFCSLIGGQHST